eukprot:TRINITY_DN8908_c0_g1_i2.p1 TRINITY_DN8908_c0_g1~~TRINITY_DN8908_c0_g1_i2.p1  ORF type:complete len:1109 (+),score=135.27 TRINITY_DN8908_c0_g1_i2:104-3430(+)
MEPDECGAQPPADRIVWLPSDFVWNEGELQYLVSRACPGARVSHWASPEGPRVCVAAKEPDAVAAFVRKFRDGRMMQPGLDCVLLQPPGRRTVTAHQLRVLLVSGALDWARSRFRARVTLRPQCPTGLGCGDIRGPEADHMDAFFRRLFSSRFSVDAQLGAFDYPELCFRVMEDHQVLIGPPPPGPGSLVLYGPLDACTRASHTVREALRAGRTPISSPTTPPRPATQPGISPRADPARLAVGGGQLPSPDLRARAAAKRHCAERDRYHMAELREARARGMLDSLSDHTGPGQSGSGPSVSSQAITSERSTPPVPRWSSPAPTPEPSADQTPAAGCSDSWVSPPEHAFPPPPGGPEELHALLTPAQRTAAPPPHRWQITSPCGAQARRSMTPEHAWQWPPGWPGGAEYHRSPHSPPRSHDGRRSSPAAPSPRSSGAPSCVRPAAVSPPAGATHRADSLGSASSSNEPPPLLPPRSWEVGSGSELPWSPLSSPSTPSRRAVLPAGTWSPPSPNVPPADRCLQQGGGPAGAGHWGLDGTLPPLPALAQAVGRLRSARCARGPEPPQGSPSEGGGRSVSPAARAPPPGEPRLAPHAPPPLPPRGASGEPPADSAAGSPRRASPSATPCGVLPSADRANARPAPACRPPHPWAGESDRAVRELFASPPAVERPASPSPGTGVAGRGEDAADGRPPSVSAVSARGDGPPAPAPACGEQLPAAGAGGDAGSPCGADEDDDVSVGGLFPLPSAAELNASPLPRCCCSPAGGSESGSRESSVRTTIRRSHMPPSPEPSCEPEPRPQPQPQDRDGADSDSWDYQLLQLTPGPPSPLLPPAQAAPAAAATPAAEPPAAAGAAAAEPRAAAGAWEPAPAEAPAAPGGDAAENAESGLPAWLSWIGPVADPQDEGAGGAPAESQPAPGAESTAAAAAPKGAARRRTGRRSASRSAQPPAGSPRGCPPCRLLSEEPSETGQPRPGPGSASPSLLQRLAGLKRARADAAPANAGPRPRAASAAAAPSRRAASSSAGLPRQSQTRRTGRKAPPAAAATDSDNEAASDGSDDGALQELLSELLERAEPWRCTSVRELRRWLQTALADRTRPPEGAKRRRRGGGE